MKFATNVKRKRTWGGVGIDEGETANLGDLRVFPGVSSKINDIYHALVPMDGHVHRILSRESDPGLRRTGQTVIWEPGQGLRRIGRIVMGMTGWLRNDL
jgi:hypothetical protein